jgi:hypothetical protein
MLGEIGFACLSNLRQGKVLGLEALSMKLAFGGFDRLQSSKDHDRHAHPCAEFG